jgi:hypothetical protein
MENDMTHEERVDREIVAWDEFAKVSLPALCARYLPNRLKSDAEMEEIFGAMAKLAYKLSHKMVMERCELYQSIWDVIPQENEQA